ncbi:short-chain dehydrogenase [Pseudoalteromonas luteoviolacea]|uniref:Short-chain dehydrogenase n=1 Tax=Pseudoalteromonas luteoviolacea TaxID=43657 RepID=A0A1C0TS73_9GAMM|nr:SDR family NAD(P)-dependent oxidoreductase [Pseudoalteromonas luteoviolacea]MBQ4810657.1 SDR family NAD(P)-dependent oxidoreductase [Pseudoalteromonas luteoviolacea]OCQ22016.1 short-chain dehydrogenase [Pseudoalteromonas luteoviolacea]
MTRDGLKKVLITGATSGIGEGLVDRYSKSHNVVACGRNEEKLSKLSGNNVQTLKFDMTEKAQVASAFVDIEQLDIVILNAGVCEYIDDARRFDAELFERVIHANVIATGYCIEALLPKLKPGGQLVIVSSSASFLPLPRAQAYGASKAALSYLTRVMQIELEDIDVTLVHPGFVETPLTDKNDFPMPFLVTVENACEAIFQGVESRKKEIHFPKRFTLLLKLFALLPFSLWMPLAKRIKR